MNFFESLQMLSVLNIAIGIICLVATTCVISLAHRIINEAKERGDKLCKYCGLEERQEKAIRKHLQRYDD